MGCRCSALRARTGPRPTFNALLPQLVARSSAVTRSRQVHRRPYHRACLQWSAPIAQHSPTSRAVNLSCPTIWAGLCVSRLGRSKVCHFAQFANGGPPSSDCSSAWWPVERTLASLSTSNPFALPLRRVSLTHALCPVRLLLWRVWGGRTLTFPCSWQRVRPCLGNAVLRQFPPWLCHRRRYIG